MTTCLDLFKLSSCDNSGEFPASPSKTKITNAINISSMESGKSLELEQPQYFVDRRGTLQAKKGR